MRPSKYKEKYNEDMLEWFQHGDWAACPTFEKYAINIGVDSSTLRRWKDEHDEFQATYRKCKDIQLSIMIDGGMTGEFKGPFTIFAMKNMHNWTDKVQQEMSGSMAVEPLESYLRRKKQEGEDA